MSTLTLDQDETDLFATTVAWIGEHEPARAVRERTDSGEPYDRALWRRACRQLGVAGVVGPDEVGAAGLPERTLSVVCEAAGTGLGFEPLLPTVALAGTALRMLPASPARDALLSAIVEGDRLAALAVGAAGGPFALGGSVRAGGVESGSVGTGGDFLEGWVPAVVGGVAADVLVVVADDGGMYTVRPDDPGVTVFPRTTLDLGRPVAALRLESAPAERLGGSLDVERLVATAAVHQLAELVGVASACLEAAVGFARTRVQFGRTIGSFQAVKHRCVEMLVDLERARSQVYAARAALDEPDLPVAASAARVVAVDAARRIAASALHVHGGLGFTWEHDIHLYLRRTKAAGPLLGPVDAHLTLLADRIGLVTQRAEAL